MSEQRNSLFSSDRINLFTDLNTNDIIKGQKLGSNHHSILLSPTEYTNSEKILQAIIKKKDLKIKELTKKLKGCQTQLAQSKNQLQTKDYQMEFFKEKMREQLNKSKFYEKQIEKANKKFKQFTDSLIIVDKLKNPLQLLSDKEERKLQDMEKQNKNKGLMQKISIKQVQTLEKTIAKVAIVIQTALNIKKTKKDKISSETEKKSSPKHQTKNLDYYYYDR